MVMVNSARVYYKCWQLQGHRKWGWVSAKHIVVNFPFLEKVMVSQQSSCERTWKDVCPTHWKVLWRLMCAFKWQDYFFSLNCFKIAFVSSVVLHKKWKPNSFDSVDKTGEVSCEWKGLEPHKCPHIVWSNTICPPLLYFCTLCFALKREIRAVPLSADGTLLFPLSNTRCMLTRRKTVWLLAPFSTTLPGVAESDRIGCRVSTLKFQAITKQEVQTGHLDSDATPMLRLHSLISADAFMLTKSR